MTPIVYRAPCPEAWRIAHLDAFSALYHRASGLTHLIAPPGLEIITALGEAGLTRDALVDALAAQYDLLDFDTAALDERLAELVATGLVTTA